MTTEERPASREEAVERVLDVLPRDLDVYEASRIAIAVRNAYEAGRASMPCYRNYVTEVPPGEPAIDCTDYSYQCKSGQYEPCPSCKARAGEQR